MNEVIPVSSLLDISISELSSYVFSPGYIFLNSKKGKPILLIRAGDPITQDYLKKFTDKGVEKFKCFFTANKELEAELVEQLSGFEDSLDEHEKVLNCQKVSKWFREYYWTGVKNANVLDLINACYKTFNKLDESIIKNYREKSLNLYLRSQITSSISVILGIISGITDKKFLQDLYHGSFLLDYGVVDNPEISFRLLEAFEEERKKVNAGKEKLATQNEKKLFLNHGLLGATKVSEGNTNIFNYKTSERIIKYHQHGRNSNIESEVSGEWFSDFESVISLVDHLISFTPEALFVNDGKGYFQKQFLKIEESGILLNLPGKRLIKLIKMKMSEETATPMDVAA